MISICHLNEFRTQDLTRVELLDFGEQTFLLEIGLGLDCHGREGQKRKLIRLVHSLSVSLVLGSTPGVKEVLSWKCWLFSFRFIFLLFLGSSLLDRFVLLISPS